MADVLMTYIMGSTSIIVVVCLFMAFEFWRLRRKIHKAMEQENGYPQYTRG